MAETCASEDGPKKKKSVLEDKSKEELVQLVRKQLTLLQKAKGKSDELSKKCEILEKEKNSIEDEKSSVAEQIDILKRNISELYVEKHKYAEKENEILKLKEDLQQCQNEKNTALLISREKDEQIQCLSMKLDTIKATCHCFQDELEKLQKSNKEMAQQVELMKEARDAAVKSLKDQSQNFDENKKSYNKLVDEINDLKEKIEYYKSRSETEIECKSGPNKDNEKLNDDLITLVEKNQALTQKLNNAESENENLKEKVLQLENMFEQNDSSLSFVKSKQEGDQSVKSKSDDGSSQIALFDKRSAILRTGDRQMILEKKNISLSEQIKVLIAQNSEMETKLNVCIKEKILLEDEIKRLVSLNELNDFKTGFEHAVLQGAITEGFEHVAEKPDIKKSNHEVICLPKNETVLKDDSGYRAFAYNFSDCLNLDTNYTEWGLEHAILQGGDIEDITEPMVNLSSANEDIQDNSIIQKFDELKLVKNNLYEDYKTLEKNHSELKQDLLAVKKKSDEYSMLLNDTLKENESLKSKLDSLKKEKQEAFENKTMLFADQWTNTESEELENVMQLLKEKDSIPNLDENTAKSDEKYEFLSNENDILRVQIKNFSKSIQDLELSKVGLETRVGILEKQNIELNRKLEQKCNELNEYNLQLELLVIGMKQGVRQKTTATYKAENHLSENINALKVLIDDLILRSNNNAMKLKNLESDFDCLMDKQRSLEDELFQVKKLNEFLEEEAKVRNEEEHSKFAIDSANKFEVLGAGFDEPFPKSSPELYSIEESSEFDDKPLLSEASYANEVFNIAGTSDLQEDSYKIPKEIETEVLLPLHESAVKSVEDVSIQVDLAPFAVGFNGNVPNVLVETNFEDDFTSKIALDENAALKEENSFLKQNISSLKETLNNKSTLVEKIHCEMDNLLTKTEELSTQLQEKDDDLRNCMKVNLNNIEKLNHYHNTEDCQREICRLAVHTIDELKHSKNCLNNDIKSLALFSKDMISILNNNIKDVMSQCCATVTHLQEQCIHNEKFISNIRSYLSAIKKDFELWLKFIKDNSNIKDYINMNLLSKQHSMNYLEKTLEDSSVVCSCFEEKCGKDSCLAAVEDFKLFNSVKINLLSTLYKYLIYESSLKDLNCKPKIPTEGEVDKEKEYEHSNENALNQMKSDDQADLKIKTSLETLRSQLMDTEQKMNKFKQIALKLKKELAESKKQLEEFVHGKENDVKKISELQLTLEKMAVDQCQYMQNYQSLQNEYDKLQDASEDQKLSMKRLEEDLASTLQELNLQKEQVLELESQLKKLKHLLESNVASKQEIEEKCAGFESKVIVLESKLEEKDLKIEALQNDIKAKLTELNVIIEEKNCLKEELEYAQKEGKKKNLLDLEMADYERSITELNNQIQKKDSEINDLQCELRCQAEKLCSLQEEIKYTELLKETEEKRAINLKEVLEKTKLELSQSKEHEAVLLGTTSSLKVQLEVITQEEEHYKLQLSDVSAEIQHLKDVIKTSAENHQRIVRSLESKISNQKHEILIAHKEVESIKQEFENYKIRVHSVLKQQKTSNPALISVDADLKEKLETMNEKLKLQVNDLSEKLTALNLEYEALQDEHDNLLQKYNKAIDDREKKDTEWHQRLELVNAEKNRLRATQEELSSQHLLQNEMLVATYKKQIKIMSEEHKRTVSELQKQLDAADVEISRLQRDQQKLHGLPVTSASHDNSVPFDILSQERQEGEGSESTDGTSTPIRHLSLATIPTSGFLPFEKLLQSPLEPGTPASFISSQDSEKLTADLNAANKKIEHLSELLNDSESTNLRLGEQVRVLKEEVRRLERNKEREQHAENLEYLKNVFVKFAMLQPCSEKAMLIPVLTTMLKLSPEEQQQLKSIAGDVEPPDPTSGGGWGSYLHRWSGLA